MLFPNCQQPGTSGMSAAIISLEKQTITSTGTSPLNHLWDAGEASLICTKLSRCCTIFGLTECLLTQFTRLLNDIDNHSFINQTEGGTIPFICWFSNDLYTCKENGWLVLKINLF